MTVYNNSNRISDDNLENEKAYINNDDGIIEALVYIYASLLNKGYESSAQYSEKLIKEYFYEQISKGQYPENKKQYESVNTILKSIFNLHRKKMLKN